MATLSLREKLVRLRPDMLKIARGYCTTEEEAEDFVQEKIVRLLENEERYTPARDPDDSYIKNKFVETTYTQKRERVRVEAERIYAGCHTTTRWDPLSVLDEPVEDTDRYFLTQCLFASIPPDHFEILFHRLVNHRTDQQISEMFGVPIWKIQNIVRWEKRNIRRKAKLLNLFE